MQNDEIKIKLVAPQTSPAIKIKLENEAIAISDHAKLVNRDLPNQHPQSSITGLEQDIALKASKADLSEGLATKQPLGDYATYSQGKKADVSQLIITASYDGGGANTYTLMNMPEDIDFNQTNIFNIKYTIFNHNANTKLIRPANGNRPQEQYSIQYFGSNIQPYTISGGEIFQSVFNQSNMTVEIMFKDLEKRNLQDVLNGINTGYCPPDVIKSSINALMPDISGLATNTELQQTAQIVATNTYNASIAYADSLVKQYETVSLYITPTGLSTNKPTGVGSVIEKVLNTTEQVIWQGQYTITSAGIVLKDNLYIENIFFNSISTSRITYLRTVYTINDIVIFDVLTAMNNTVGTYELSRQILNQLTDDLKYNAGAIAKLTLYGYVSSGTDRIEFLINNVDTPSGLYRNAPISTLSKAYVDGELAKKLEPANIKAGDNIDISKNGNDVTIGYLSDNVFIDILQTSGNITLNSNTLCRMIINANTTFILPNISDDNIFNQILIQATIVGTPTIDWGLSAINPKFFGGVPPEIKSGAYNFIWERRLGEWSAGAIYLGTI